MLQTHHAKFSRSFLVAWKIGKSLPQADEPPQQMGLSGKSNDKNIKRKKPNGRRTLDLLMLDSGTTSHFTPLADIVHSKTPCDTTIFLADNSKMVSSSKGVHSVQFCTD